MIKLNSMYTRPNLIGFRLLFRYGRIQWSCTKIEKEVDFVTGLAYGTLILWVKAPWWVVRGYVVWKYYLPTNYFFQASIVQNQNIIFSQICSYLKIKQTSIVENRLWKRKYEFLMILMFYRDENYFSVEYSDFPNTKILFMWNIHCCAALTGHRSFQIIS